MSEYATLDELEALNETDVEIDGKNFRIKSASLKDMMRLQSLGDIEKIDPDKMSDLMSRVLSNCLVAPEVGPEDVDKLGKFIMPLFNEIAEFSAGGVDVEELQDEE